jgi:ABC-type lipoprotein release transport system permease subunit
MLPLAAMIDLAWRNLWRNYRRTVIMLMAIVLGVWAMIFMNAVMRGMVDDMVRTGIKSLPGHAQIHAAAFRDDPSVVNSMAPPSAAIEAVLEREEIVGWSTRVRVPAVVASERESRGLVLLGIDPLTEVPLGFTPDDIVEGRFLTGADDRGLVLGARMVERLETRLGKRVVVMSQDPDNEIADRGFRVVGIYKARLPMMEEQFAYAGRDTLQEMLKLGDAISEVAVLGNQYRDLSAWYAPLQAVVGEELELQAWTELDPYLGIMLGYQDGMILVFGLVIFAVLAFGLVNTIVMAVFERVREFGLMQALGMRPQTIIYQVLMEAFLLLALGLLIGNLQALATILPLESGIDISSVGDDALDLAGMSATLYPTLRLEDMLSASVLVIVLGLLASLLPAWRASRFDPIEALGKT